MSKYEFTVNWFDHTARPLWTRMIPDIAPRRCLEIGSYEGASACFLIDALAPRHPIELHCVDTWEGGREHRARGEDMAAVERRFDANIATAIAAAGNPVQFRKHKGPASRHLPRLISEESLSGYFDFVYVDGSHEAADVLFDGVLGFELLSVGGTMVFDDYIWNPGDPRTSDPLGRPKPAIDALTGILARKIRIVGSPNLQMVLRRIAP